MIVEINRKERFCSGKSVSNIKSSAARLPDGWADGRRCRAGWSWGRAGHGDGPFQGRNSPASKLRWFDEVMSHGRSIHFQPMPRQRNKAVDRQGVQAELEKANYLLKIIPHVDGSPRILELIDYRLEDIVMKGAWTGPATLGDLLYEPRTEAHRRSHDRRC
jgi:hypothetical protein